MKTTTYPGINYAGSRDVTTNCDSLTGIRYGVISYNSVMGEALDDIMTHGRDMAWEKALAEAVKEAKAKAEQAGDDPEEVNEDDVSDDLGANWESSLGNYLYESDGYKLTGCLDNDLFVMASPYFTYAQFCSPCVPGAGNLDCPYAPPSEGEPFEPANAGFPTVFALGHDWFEGGKAPYHLWSVADGKEVLPTS